MARDIKRRQTLALAALLAEPSLERAAQVSGVGQRTLQRWLRHDASFRDALSEMQRAVVRHTSARLQEVSTHAVETLEAIMRDDTAPPAARVSAARVCLESAFKSTELNDLSERLAALEAGTGGDGVAWGRS